MKRKITELRSNEGIHCSTEIEFDLIKELFEEEGFRLDGYVLFTDKANSVFLRNGNIEKLSHCIQDEKSIYSAADYLESPMDLYGKQVEVKEKDEHNWFIGYVFVGLCPITKRAIVLNPSTFLSENPIYESFKFVRPVK